MTERLNNGVELNTDDNASVETNYPAFSTEAAQQRIAEYKAEHPNAIDDVDKAYAMAKAGNFDRTDEAKFNRLAKEETDPKEKAEWRLSAKLARKDAEAAEEEAGEEYDRNMK